MYIPHEPIPPRRRLVINWLAHGQMEYTLVWFVYMLLLGLVLVIHWRWVYLGLLGSFSVWSYWSGTSLVCGLLLYYLGSLFSRASNTEEYIFSPSPLLYIIHRDVSERGCLHLIAGYELHE